MREGEGGGGGGRKKKARVPISNRKSLVRTGWRRDSELIAKDQITSLSARVSTGETRSLPVGKNRVGVPLAKTQFSTPGAPLSGAASPSVKVAEGMGGNEGWLFFGGGGRRNKIVLAIGVEKLIENLDFGKNEGRILGGGLGRIGER